MCSNSFICRPGEYVVPPQFYSASRVGPKALARRELEILLHETGIHVETSVSLQYGSLKKMLQHHPENSELECLIRRIQALRKQARALAPGSETAALLNNEIHDRLIAAGYDPTCYIPVKRTDAIARCKHCAPTHLLRRHRPFQPNLSSHPAQQSHAAPPSPQHSSFRHHASAWQRPPRRLTVHTTRNCHLLEPPSTRGPSPRSTSIHCQRWPLQHYTCPTPPIRLVSTVRPL